MSLKAIRKVLSSSDGFKYNDRWAKSKRYPTTRPYTPLKLFTARPSYGEMIWRHCNFRISKQNSMVVLSFYKMKFPALFLRKTQFIKASYAKNRCFLVLRISKLVRSVTNYPLILTRLFIISHVKLQNCHGNLLYVSVPRWRRTFQKLWMKMSGH